MSYDICGKTELEYEFVYNLRDQTRLFLRMNPDTGGYANELLASMNEMVDSLQRKLIDGPE